VPGPDEVAFKAAMSHFATGVAVVTASTDSGPAGFTCQSFGSLSLTPPMVSFAARVSGSSWPRIRAVATVAINVLRAGHEEIALAFATSDIDKFASVRHAPGKSGAPVLADALMVLEGEIVSTVTHGDHDVAVVMVQHASVTDGEPLIYFRRQYGSFTN
jgi:3-hydroxy-9,10-secoandrosta-1,3,5(10)-triene-9,17-dione monooxygenase reductase component